MCFPRTQPPGACGRQAQREDTEEEKAKTKTSTETMREWSEPNRRKGEHAEFHRPSDGRCPVPAGASGGVGRVGRRGHPGHKRLAVLPGAGQGAGAVAVQGAGRGQATLHT